MQISEDLIMVQNGYVANQWSRLILFLLSVLLHRQILQKQVLSVFLKMRNAKPDDDIMDAIGWNSKLQPGRGPL